MDAGRRSWFRAAFLATVGLVISDGPSTAAPLTVVNPGFEDISGETQVGEFTFGPLTGWGLYDPGSITAGGAGGTYFLGTLTPFEPDPIGDPGVFAFFPDGAPEGQRVGIAFNFFGSGDEGEWGFVQVLGDVLEANTIYTLRVEIGNIASGTATSMQFFPLDGFPGYRVDLMVGDDLPTGGTVLAQDVNSLAGSLLDGEFGESVVQIAIGDSHPRLGEALGIRLVSLNVVDPMYPNSDLEVDFDDVRLDATPVPAHVPSLSPAGVAVLIAGLTALGSVRGRNAARDLVDPEEVES